MIRYLPLALPLSATLLFFTSAYFSRVVLGVLADHVVISEVQVSGIDDPNNDFIELYNPTDTPVDLKDMKLVKRTRTGTSDTGIVSFVDGDSIPAHGFFLWCNTSLSESLSCDATTGATIANNNSISLREEPSDTGTLIDAVTIGAVANPHGEGTPVVPDPEDNGSIERKAHASSSTESMTTGADALLGNGEDTGDNAQDFVYHTSSNPQNSQSSTETPLQATPSVSPSPTGTGTPSPTNEPTLTPSPSPATSGTPSITPSSTPTSVPTITPEPTQTPTISPSDTPTPMPSNTPIPTNTPTTTPLPSPTHEPTPTRNPTPTPPKDHTRSRIVSRFLFFTRIIECRQEYREVRFGYYKMYLPRLVCEDISWNTHHRKNRW